jgi:hypothetical protein
MTKVDGINPLNLFPGDGFALIGQHEGRQVSAMVNITGNLAGFAIGQLAISEQGAFIPARAPDQEVTFVKFDRHGDHIKPGSLTLDITHDPMAYQVLPENITWQELPIVFQEMEHYEVATPAQRIVGVELS